MIYWLINYLNCKGYYFNGSGFCYYPSDHSEYIYNIQQQFLSGCYETNQSIGYMYTVAKKPRLSGAQRRKIRRSKMKLAEQKNLVKSQETRSQEVKCKEKACGNGKAASKCLAALGNTKSLAQKLVEKQVKPDNDAKQISVEKIPKQMPKAAGALQQNGSIKEVRNKFSVNDPNTPEFMQSLAEAFHAEIALMQSRLTAESALRPIHNDNDLMVAKIHIENYPQISDDLFEFIRTELVGWIGVYQAQGMSTPIFHNITKNDCYLTVVCDNKYAYECVERCVADLAQTNTIGSLKLLTLPPITPIIYCFDAKYEGIASDADLFLSQLRLHKSKLHSNDWLVVSQKVCLEERRTYFIFLVDECSALALNFHYNLSFYVCMQQVTFRSRGIVATSL